MYQASTLALRGSQKPQSISLLGEEGQEAGAVGLRLDVDDGGVLGE